MTSEHFLVDIHETLQILLDFRDHRNLMIKSPFLYYYLIYYYSEASKGSFENIIQEFENNI